MDNSKTVPQRRCQHACPCGRSHQGKLGKIQPDGPGTGAFADDNVNGVIFHGRVEYFLHLPVQAMDLIHKKHIPLLEVVQDGSHLPRLFNGRPGGDFHVNIHLIGNDARQRSLSKTRRAVEQDMVQSFAPGLCRLNIDLQCGLCLLLPDVIFQILGTETVFYLNIFFQIFCCDNSSCHVIYLLLEHH